MKSGEESWTEGAWANQRRSCISVTVTRGNRTTRRQVTNSIRKVSCTDGQEEGRTRLAEV